MNPESPHSLLRLDRRDMAGLRWIHARSRFWRTVLKRRRKYGIPRGAGFDPEEAEALQALADLERAASVLLGRPESGA